MTLLEFLRRRLAVDKDNFTDGLGDYYENEHCERMLLETAAKLRIVATAEATESAEVHADAWVAMQDVLRDLASVYGDEPGYRPEWRPRP